MEMETFSQETFHGNCDSTKSLKIHALKLNLQQVFASFEEVEQEFQDMKMQTQVYKSQYLSQMEQCKSQSCKSSEDLKETITSNEQKIQYVVSTLRRLDETRNFTLLRELFRILCGEETTLTPPKEEVRVDVIDCEMELPSSTGLISTPKEEQKTISFKDESVSEIEGTPTGRVSPIIPSKKLKSRNTTNTSEAGVKKKTNESTSEESERKYIKLSTPGGGRGGGGGGGTRAGRGRLRQARLNLIRAKPRLVVDIASSPDLAARGEHLMSAAAVKKESIESDDTILPSPTSNPLQNTFSTVKVNGTRCSPSEVKVSPPVKQEPLSSTFTEPSVMRLAHPADEDPGDSDATHMEQSINLLNPFRLPSTPRKRDRVKQPVTDENARHVGGAGDAGSGSLSILQQVNQLDRGASDVTHKLHCAARRPLSENVNVSNTQRDACASDDADARGDVSLSLLHRDKWRQRVARNTPEKVELPPARNMKTPEKVEPIYKEPTVRKKADKMKLPGWSCEQCRVFYDELYKDNPEMLYKLMQECSRHRGRRDPARPPTPPGYWYPRWDVPSDTEAFNLRNNAT